MSERVNLVYLDCPWKADKGGVSVKGVARGAQHKYPLMTNDEIVEYVTELEEWDLEDDVLVGMWATNASLPDAMALIPRLGFRYVCLVPWVKMRESSTAFRKTQIAVRKAETNEELYEAFLNHVSTGMGWFQRGASEVLLLCVKGSPLKRYPNRFNADVYIDEEEHKRLRGTLHPDSLITKASLKGVIFGPRRAHSRKPDEAREWLDARVRPDARKLEIFARVRDDGTFPDGWIQAGNEAKKRLEAA